jgi:hypothetical protein
MLSLPKKIFFLFSALSIAIVLFSVLAGSAKVTSAGQTMDGLNAAAGASGLQTSGDGAITDLPTTIGKIIGTGLSFIGVIFFVLMIYGGIIWMTARGNDQQVQKAKGIMESAIIGLIIVLSAYAITAFIGDQLTGR